MNAAPSWQWRTWRGRRHADNGKDPAMPPSERSEPFGVRRSETHALPLAPHDGPRPSAERRTPHANPVPPAPAPVQAEQPAPRVVWEDPGNRTVRLIATDWADGVAPTYSVQAAHGSSWWASGDGTLWVPATGEEWMAMFIALATALDERTPRPAPQRS